MRKKKHYVLFDISKNNLGKYLMHNIFNIITFTERDSSSQTSKIHISLLNFLCFLS